MLPSRDTHGKLTTCIYTLSYLPMHHNAHCPNMTSPKTLRVLYFFTTILISLCDVEERLQLLRNQSPLILADFISVELLERINRSSRDL